MEVRSQSPASLIIEDYASLPSIRDSTTQDAAAHESYGMTQVRRPDDSFKAMRRKLPSRGSGIGPDPSSPDAGLWSTASSGIFKTVITRTSDGSLVKVQRPVRESEQSTSKLSSHASQGGPGPWTVSRRCSSVYKHETNRDTIMSTPSLVHYALAEQQTYRRVRGSRRVSIRSSAPVLSGTSGDIQIGHIDEGDENTQEKTDCSASLHSQESEEHVCAKHGCANHGRRGLWATHSLTHSITAYDSHQLYEAALADVQGRPSGLMTFYPNDGKTPPSGPAENPHEAHGDMYPLIPNTQKTISQPKPLLRLLILRLCSYLLAICSILLPIVFLALGIAIMFMGGQSVASRWSVIEDLINVAVTLWPIVFAAVVAQCFKAGVIFRSNGNRNGPTNMQLFGIRHSELLLLETTCVLLFLVFGLSTIGSHALLHAQGVGKVALQGQLSVWYVDQTGYNQLWAPNSTSTLSAAVRSELVQAAAERYTRSLSPSDTPSGMEEVTTPYSSSTATFIMDANDSTSSSDNTGGHSHPVLQSRSEASIGSRSDTGTTEAFETMTFVMMTSAFSLDCGDWTTMTRAFENITSPDQLHYSASQTLGMRMAGNSSSNSSSTLQFVSLNRAPGLTTTGSLLGRGRGTDNSSVSAEPWEYSSINCSFDQRFYHVPVQCHRDDSTGQAICIQSGVAELSAVPDATLNTELGDFSLDFVWSGNLPTTGLAATPSEMYIQNKGSSGQSSLSMAAKTPPVDDDNNDVTTTNAVFNLSSAVSPAVFAQRFGRLFNSWVSLGYCPQCSSSLSDNATAIPTNLRPYYHEASSTSVRAGEELYDINWAWLAVFIVTTSVLLIAGVGSAAVESILVHRRIGWRGARRASGRFPLRLPTMHSTLGGRDSHKRSPWGRAVVVQDRAAAADARNPGVMYR